MLNSESVCGERDGTSSQVHQMRLIYSFLYTCAFLLALPYFLIAGLFRGKYLTTAGQRLGFGLPESDRPSLWIHAVSVGEYLAARPLIQKIREQFPEVPLFVSTTTKTGQRLAKDLLQDSVFYFPFDWTWCVRRVFQRIRPQLVLIMETEIWPNFLWEARKQGIAVILVSGRISDRSFARYRRFRFWIPLFDESLMQSEEDASRMKVLGAREDSVSVIGNLKFDFRPPTLSPLLRKLLQEWKRNEALWICGSTMKGEEQILIQIFQNLVRRNPMRLLIAPRHPDRFEEVANLVKQNHLSMIKRSSNIAADAEVMVLDSIGELASCYEMADVVFIGGTLGAYGGHNPIEPAYFGKAIVAGTHYENFRSVFEELLRRGAICVTRDPESEISQLIVDPKRRDQMGHAARAMVQESSGAINIVLQKVRENLDAGSMVEPDSKLSLR
jgi:3-deoxy-D-manno-octulosonic-acid transferase